MVWSHEMKVVGVRGTLFGLSTHTSDVLNGDLAYTGGQLTNGDQYLYQGSVLLRRDESFVPVPTVKEEFGVYGGFAELRDFSH